MIRSTMRWIWLKRASQAAGAIGLKMHPKGAVTFTGRKSWVVPAPIADLVTAWHSTAIPNITVSLAFPSKLARAIGFGWPLAAMGMPLLAGLMNSKAIRGRVDAAVEKRSHGPTAEGMANNRPHLYARASKVGGASVEGWMDTPDGYLYTRHSAINAVEQVLAKRPTGALSPSQAFGVDFALAVPGTKRLEKLEG